MYLDPPYNQHRYFTNYHVWETLVRWDEPEHYGIACKRVDARDDDDTRSVFNSKQHDAGGAGGPDQPGPRRPVVVVSYNDESWVSPEQMTAALRDAGHEAVRGAGLRLQEVRRRADRHPRPRRARRSVR